MLSYDATLDALSFVRVALATIPLGWANSNLLTTRSGSETIRNELLDLAAETIIKDCHDSSDKPLVYCSIGAPVSSQSTSGRDMLECDYGGGDILEVLVCSTLIGYCLGSCGARIAVIPLATV
eukprot:2142530-Amphidinium_carterae.1